MKGSPSTDDFQAVAAGGADAGGEDSRTRSASSSIAATWFGLGGDEHGGGGLGEEAEERMNHQRLILLDGGADALWECGLGQGNGDAAVGDVARGVEQLALGQHGKQRVQIGFGVEIERRRLAPDAAENHLGVLRGAEDDQFSGGGGVGLRRVLGDDGPDRRVPACAGSAMRIAMVAGNGTSRFGSGSSPRGWARAAGWRRLPAGSAPGRPWSHRRECRRCPAPAWDRCLRRGSRCREKRCRR